MGIGLDPSEIREVFGDEDPTQHGEQARSRWGDTDAWAQSQARTSSYGKADWLCVQAEGEDVERRFAQALAAGLPADAPEVRAIAEEHRQSISRNFFECSPQLHSSLADLYVADERFAAHYDRRGPGLAQYVHDAVKGNAAGKWPDRTSAH